MKTKGQKMQHTSGIKSRGTEEFLNRTKRRRAKKAMANKTKKRQRTG